VIQRSFCRSKEREREKVEQIDTNQLNKSSRVRVQLRPHDHRVYILHTDPSIYSCVHPHTHLPHSPSFDFESGERKSFLEAHV
jgi:hypothetical protein